MHIVDLIEIYKKFSSIEVQGINYGFHLSINKIDHEKGSSELVLTKNSDEEFKEILENHILLRYRDFSYKLEKNHIFFEIRNEKEFSKLFLSYTTNFSIYANPKLKVTYS